jgi:hypothetical protein
VRNITRYSNRFMSCYQTTWRLGLSIQHTCTDKCLTSEVTNVFVQHAYKHASIHTRTPTRIHTLYISLGDCLPNNCKNQEHTFMELTTNSISREILRLPSFNSRYGSCVNIFLRCNPSFVSSVWT